MSLYPPFLKMGVKVEVLSSEDRTVQMRLPLQWSSRNMHGSMFGGWICAATDPILAVLCGEIFPLAVVWTKKHSVEFLKPATTDLTMKYSVSDDEFNQMKTSLEKNRSHVQSFQFFMKDQKGLDVAKIETEVYLSRRKTK